VTNKSGPLNAWVAKKAGNVRDPGQTISSPRYKPVDWIEAVVPGTVLTSSTSVPVASHTGLRFCFGESIRVLDSLGSA
jgi:hypothetical protein